MRKSCLIVLLFALLTCQLPAQSSAYYESFAQYKDAVELFDKAKYGAAQQKFGSFIEATESSSIPENLNDLRAEARFYQALSAFKLLRNNTQSLFQEFISTHPSHSRVNESWYYMGKLHFIKREYKEAVPYLEKVDKSKLASGQGDDARFMQGYAYYHDKDLNKATPIFYQLSRGNSVHKEQSSYYYSVIQYSRGNYNQAYEGFRKIEDVKKFDKNIPIYIANCLLKLEKYDELDDYGQEMTSSRKAPKELLVVLANAAYERNNWSRCIEYFEQFGAQRMDRESRYRLGYSHYELGHYAEAEKQFTKVLRPEDDLAQNALYHLGHCYVKAEDYSAARTAFRKASKAGNDAKVKEEALFQYGKASFQTAEFQDAYRAFKKLDEQYPNSEYNGEAQSLMGEILLNSSDFQAAIDYFEKSDLRSERAQKSYQRACYYYGLDQYEKAQYETASTYFKKALNLRYDLDVTLSSYYWYAEARFQDRKFGEAKTYYQQFLDHPQAHRHEDYGRAYYGLAWCNLKLKSYRAASRNFEKFIAISNRTEEPELYVDAYLRAGDCEFISKRWDNALNYYQQVRDFNYRHADYALFQVGQSWFRKGDYRKSAQAYQEIAAGYKTSDYHDDALLQLSRIYLTELKEWNKSVEFGKVLIRDHPNSPYVPEAYLMMGFAEMYSNNNEAAIRHFKRVVLDYCDDADRVFDVLETLVSIMAPGEYDQLERDLRKKCPDINEGGNPRGATILFARVENAFFEDDFNSVLTLSNNFFQDYPSARQRHEVRFYRARAYEETGQIDKALQDYEQVYKLTPLHDRSIESFQRAGDIQFDRGNYLISMELFTQMEEKADQQIDKVMAQFGLAQNHFKLEDYSSAKQVLLKIHSNENSTQYSKDRAYVQIGNCEYELGNVPRAEQIFTEIETKYNNVFAAESKYMLTKILYDKGQYEASIKSAGDFKTDYPGYNYWKAKAYLVVADDYYQLGNLFQAKGGLEILATQTDFPDVAEEAATRLAEIEAAEGADSIQGDSLNE